MSFNTDWDVDQFKTEHECDEHWELRRSFMVAHKDKFPEERLVCLAQVFTNIEFLGCRYPSETMQLVDKLAKGVADSYREKQKSRLQRTFVKASDAAGAKAKGLKRPLENEATGSASSSEPKSEISDPTKRFSLDCVQQNRHFTSKSETSKFSNVTYGPSIIPESQNSSQSDASANGSSRFNNSRYGGVKTYHIGQSSAGKSLNTGTIKEGPYGKLVLIEPAYENPSITAHQILMASAGASRLHVECKYKSQPTETICEIFLNRKLLSTAKSDQKKRALALASEEGLEKLRKISYTLKVKTRILSESTIEKSLDNSSDFQQFQTQSSSVDTPLDDSNIGNKLLKLMGWSGGGLGKDQQGIAEPVSVQEHVSRAGLGASGSQGGLSEKAQVKAKVRKLIEDYARGNSQYDLVFSTEFTKEERKAMHKLANRLKLKTKSYGGEHDRYIVISKKHDVYQTVQELLECGGSNERYELVSPSSE